MEIDLAALPDDVEALHHLIGDLVAAREHERVEARAEIDRLRHIVKLLQRNRFGRRSERLDNDQMLLGIARQSGRELRDNLDENLVSRRWR